MGGVACLLASMIDGSECSRLIQPSRSMETGDGMETKGDKRDKLIERRTSERRVASRRRRPANPKFCYSHDL